MSRDTILKKKAAPLDKYYIPTHYPNGLPDGIPAEAFDAVDAEHALGEISDRLCTGSYVTRV
jgi:hypothetical protein